MSTSSEDLMSVIVRFRAGLVTNNECLHCVYRHGCNCCVAWWGCRIVVGAAFVGMDEKIVNTLTFSLKVSSYRDSRDGVAFRRRNSDLAIVRVAGPARCLLLPIRRGAPRTRIYVTSSSIPMSVSMHLSERGISCLIPFTLPGKRGRMTIHVHRLPGRTLY